MEHPQKRKTLHSQNFLKNDGFVEDLIQKSVINNNDLVVEIGSGKGIITKSLSNHAKQVLAIEIDKNLVNYTTTQLRNCSNVQVIHTDFLKWTLPTEPYKVFSNIPFNRTADIVSKLFNNGNPPVVAYLIMQNKAAERFVGFPVATNTQVSILLKILFEVEVVTKISRQQFEPAPQVDATLVRFQKRKTPLLKENLTQQFRDFVVYGYNQWKPTTLGAFKRIFSNKQRSIIEVQLDIKGAKPSDLTLEQWLSLFDIFIKHVPQNKKVLVKGAEEELLNQQSKLIKQHRTRM